MFVYIYTWMTMREREGGERDIRQDREICFLLLLLLFIIWFINQMFRTVRVDSGSEQEPGTHLPGAWGNPRTRGFTAASWGVRRRTRGRSRVAGKQALDTGLGIQSSASALHYMLNPFLDFITFALTIIFPLGLLKMVKPLKHLNNKQH